MANKTIYYEVVFGNASKQKLLNVTSEKILTIEDAILHSGIFQHYPEIDLSKQKVGVFGKIRHLNDLVQDGDRIEIYRSLLVDPKEARRQRVK